jgi:hypothetical protein
MEARLQKIHSFALVMTLIALMGSNASALTIKLNVDYDDRNSLPTEEVRKSLTSGSIFTPDILQATKDAQEVAEVEIKFPYQLLLQVGNIKTKRFALSDPSDKLLEWSYQSSVSHPISGNRGEHKFVLVLPSEKIEAAKLKNALLWATWRSLFYEQISVQYPKLNLYIAPINVTFGPTDEGAEIADLQKGVPARLMEGAERLFAFAAMRTVADQATQAQIDQYMNGLPVEASYKGLVSLAQSKPSQTEGITAMIGLLKQSLDRAIQVSQRWPRSYSSLSAAENALSSKVIRTTMLTAIAVNLRARHGIKRCQDLLISNPTP